MSKIAYKLKAFSPTNSEEAQKLFFELGYKPDFEYKFPLAPYLYANSNGRLGFDFFDSKDHVQEIVSTSAYYFEHHEATEITIEALRELINQPLDANEAKYYAQALIAEGYVP